MRHDRVGARVHYWICKALGIGKQTSKPVCEHEDVTVLWNQEVHTDREVTANRPDIIIKNRKEKTCILIDVAIPAERNFIKKVAGKKTNTRMFV
jgi:hypothetical protein